MAVLKIAGRSALAAMIACEIPALAGAICEGQAGPSHELEFPSLQITIERSRYLPDQEDVHFSPSANTVVLNVGRHVQEIKLKLGSSSDFQRAELEQKIIDLFLVTEGHPGVLFTQLTDCEDLGPFVAAWELEDEDWQDEKAFDRQYYSELTITGILPALVTRRGVYDMNQILLGVDIGVSADPTLEPSDFPTYEVVTINEDGAIYPA